MDNSKEYILCSAIKRIVPKENSIYHNNDLFEIEIGLRHCDIYARFHQEISRSPKHQGFYTSKGRYVDRQEALSIALKCGQVKLENLHNSSIGLMSEDLY